MSTLILQGAKLDTAAIEQLSAQIQANAIESGRAYSRLTLSEPLSTATLNHLRQQYPFDINMLPADFDSGNIRLLLTDMDSTLINIECIDEVADVLGIKTQVADVTAAAMRGDIDFETALNKRIQLLLELDNQTLQHVYDQRLELNPGAEDMLRGLQHNNIKVALVSGGFTFFTKRLQQRLGLDFSLANELAFNDRGKLIGLSNPVIVDAQRKADYLSELCAEMGITENQVIAIGDGANDLLMMQGAGLSVAYHAHRAVQQQATTALNHCGLEGVLGLLGIDLTA